MNKKRISALLLAVAATGALATTGQAAYKPECIKFNWNCNWEDIICDSLQNLPCIPGIPEIPQYPEIPETPIVPEVPEVPEAPETPETPEVEQNAHAYELKVLELVNAERAKYGLSALSWNDELAQVARAHSKDMATRGFFSHNTPEGKTPFDRIKSAGISYRSAGENIAAGQKTPEEVVEAWMNSEGHRANILNSSYTQIGVGYVTGNGSYSTYWTQNFIG